MKAFDNLRVQERLPDLQELSDTAQNPSETVTPLEEEERPLDSDITSGIMTTSTLPSPDPLSPTVLSTTLCQLWMDDTESNTTVVSILKHYNHICFSAIHCLIPYLQSTKIFSRILKKWDRLKPARR